MARLRPAQLRAACAVLLLVGLVAWWGAVPPRTWPPVPHATPARLEINTADSAAWEALPYIGPATARRIVRFRAALGGQFYSFGQLERVWGMDTLLPRLHDRLYLDSSALQRIEVNTATAHDFQRLPGIYPSLARRIVNYRTARGGFQQLTDLRRIYGLDSLYPQVVYWLYLDPSTVPITRTEWLVFDPPRDLNTLTLPELQATRIVPNWLAERILKYREAAGGYDSLPQLRRLYGMTDTFYTRLALNLYVQPPPDTAFTRYDAYAIQREADYNRPPAEPLNLNQAPALALESLPHLGPGLAQRIVERRTQLGFFHSLSQLEEVYNLPARALPDLKQWLYVEADLSRYPHLHVNTATVEQLAAHPYLSYSLARRLVRYRQQHGRFTRLEDLYAIGGTTAADWQRIAPYLAFD